MFHVIFQNIHLVNSKFASKSRLIILYNSFYYYFYYWISKDIKLHLKSLLCRWHVKFLYTTLVDVLDTFAETAELD